MKTSKIRFAAVVVAGALFLGACGILKTTDDRAITTDIQAKLFSDSVLKTRDIRVESQRGIVTLSGTVATDLEKAAAERIASQESGVKNVVNDITVSAQPAPAASEATPPMEATPPQAAPPPAPPEQAAAREQPRAKRHRPAAHTREVASAEPSAYADADAPPAPPNPVVTPNPAAAAPMAAAAPVAAPAAAPPPPPAPKPPDRVTIPSGTVVTVRMIDSIDSRSNRPGEEFAASVDAPIVVGDRVVVPRGVDARVRLVNAQSAGRMTGQSSLQLELVGLTINGNLYDTQSGYYEQHGASRGKRTAETVGGGAVLGALIGAIAGGGKGAAIGSAVGAGAGTGVQVATRGEQVKVPAETKLDFTLRSPVTVTMGEGE
jgi:hypothetical protein